MVIRFRRVRSSFYKRADISPIEQGLRWIFRAKTPEALARFTEPLPEVELCSLSREVGPPNPNSDFQPIGHVSLVCPCRVGARDTSELIHPSFRTGWTK